MANKMLIDATHPEETRAVVLRGNRVEEFDFESAHRKQLRGNIYLAKVTRVEPSLQAAFVDYGGNRHGFLAFSEIHPDYYQIPVADRQALIDEEERAHRDAEAEADRRARAAARAARPRPAGRHSETVSSEPIDAEVIEPVEHGSEAPSGADVAPEGHAHDATEAETGEPHAQAAAESSAAHAETDAERDEHRSTEHEEREHEEHESHAHEAHAFDEHAAASAHDEPAHAGDASERDDDEHDENEHDAGEAAARDHEADTSRRHHGDRNGDGNGEAAEGEEEEIVESVGGADAMEEVP